MSCSVICIVISTPTTTRRSCSSHVRMSCSQMSCVFERHGGRARSNVSRPMVHVSEGARAHGRGHGEDGVAFSCRLALRATRRTCQRENRYRNRAEPKHRRSLALRRAALAPKPLRENFEKLVANYEGAAAEASRRRGSGEARCLAFSSGGGPCPTERRRVPAPARLCPSRAAPRLID